MVYKIDLLSTRKHAKLVVVVVVVMVSCTIFRAANGEKYLGTGSLAGKKEGGPKKRGTKHRRKPVQTLYARSPRIRLASWMSFGMMVTRLAWIAHKLVSSNSPTK